MNTKEYVPASRLAWGRWNHATNEEEGEGDIHASYSADVIAQEGKIRKPFHFAGALWCCIGNRPGAQHRAYRLFVPLFDGQETTYTTYSKKVHVDGGEAARHDPQGFYHGMTVKRGKDTFVLIGPEVEFLPVEATTEPVAESRPAELVGQQGCLFV